MELNFPVDARGVEADDKLQVNGCCVHIPRAGVGKESFLNIWNYEATQGVGETVFI